MVGIVKQLTRKANQEGRDPHLALLEYRNTPITGLSYSPSQLLMSRMLRDKMPTSASLLIPKVPESAYDMLKLRQQKQYFDRGTRPLSKLEVGDSVRVKFGRTWTPGIISGKHSSPRSYLVTTENGRMYRRVINPSTEPPPDVTPPDDFDPPPAAPFPPAPCAVAAEVPRRMSARVRRRPGWMADYDT